MNAKKYLNLLLMIFLIVCVTISCKKSVKEIESIYLKDAISKIKVNASIKWVVILPGLGCDGCIQEGEAFMKENIGNLEVLFILSKISSLKILEQKTGIKISEHHNIYIDRGNDFNIPTDNNIYPCIIQLVNNKVSKHEFQCPRNSQAFRKLKNLILSN
jgi:hypothetical protein